MERVERLTPDVFSPVKIKKENMKLRFIEPDHKTKILQIKQLVRKAFTAGFNDGQLHQFKNTEDQQKYMKMKRTKYMKKFD